MCKYSIIYIYLYFPFFWSSTYLLNLSMHTKEKLPHPFLNINENVSNHLIPENLNDRKKYYQQPDTIHHIQFGFSDGVSASHPFNHSASQTNKQRYRNTEGQTCSQTCEQTK